jgi:hypothetical protein
MQFLLKKMQFGFNAGKRGIKYIKEAELDYSIIFGLATCKATHWFPCLIL